MYLTDYAADAVEVSLSEYQSGYAWAGGGGIWKLNLNQSKWLTAQQMSMQSKMLIIMMTLIISFSMITDFFF